MILDMLVHIGIKKGDNYQVESLIQLMDDHQVEQSMICSQLETIDNEYIYESYKKFPDRLFPFAVINPWDIEGEEDLEKYYRDYGFYGLKMNAIRYGYSADRDSLLSPYFELSDKYGKIIVAHCMSDLFSLPDKWGKMARLYPNVPILLYHFGIPSMADRAIALAKELDNVYLSTAGAYAPVIKKAYEEVGPHKIIFSSDAPFGDIDTERSKIEYITDNEEHRELMFSGNIKRLLRVE